MFLISFALALVVAGFWAWMVWDMDKNPDLPSCYVSFTGGKDIRQDWFMAFTVLSVITAGVYYVNVYNRR